MPLIPTESINPNAVDVGQGPSIARAGAASEAWARVGEKLANFGNELLDKRKKAETSSYVNTSNNDLARFVSEKETELQAQYPGDPSGYSKAMIESLNDFGSSKIDQAPNSDAKEMWSQQFANISNDIALRASAWENKKRAEHQVSLIDDSAFKDRQHLAMKPDPDTAINFLNNTLKSVNDGVGLYYDQAEASKRAKEYGTQYTSALLEGMEANKNYGTGLNILNGKDPSSPILLQYMDPTKIANYKDRFQRLSKAESEVSKSLLNKNIGDISQGYLQGFNVPEESYNQLVKQSEMLPPEERKVALDDLNVARRYGEILKNMKTLSVEELQKGAGFSLDFGQDTFNLQSRSASTKKFQEAAQNIITQKTTDGASFMASNDPQIRMLSREAMDVSNPSAISNYMNLVVEKQKQNGISSYKVLTKEQSKNYGALIKSTNPKAVNQVYEGLRLGSGEYFGNVVSEMIQNKDMPDPAMAMAMFIPDEASREASFANVSRRAEIEKAYESRSDKARGEESELFNDPEVIQIKQSIIANDRNNSRLWINNGLDSLLKLEYKAARVQNMGQKEAKETAIKKVISENFAVATGGKSSVVIPKEYFERKSVIEDFMSDSMSDDYLSGLDLATPKEYPEALKVLGKESESDARYLEDLKSSGKWIQNPSQNGVILAKGTKSGGLAPVRDKKGNLIQVLYKDMSQLNVTRKSAKEGF